jgi:UDP-glucose 6-dehydrogenase
MADKQTIGVVGVGWVGLVTASCFAELGHPVVAMDIDADKVEGLRRGEVPIHEPGLSELVSNNTERLRFTTDMREALEAATLLFCCVDTPPTVSGDADLSRVRAVLETLPEEGDHVLVMKSTVPAGTGAAIRRETPELTYVSCPEFLKEGSAVADFMHPDRVVIGADPGDEAAADAVEEVYRPLGGEIVRTDVASAEMIKLAANAFLATKISFINEIANVSEEVGADVTEVARGMGLDERIGSSFLRAGIGYGGSCFAGGETLLVRRQGEVRRIAFAQLWEETGGDGWAIAGEALAPDGLEAWSWVPGEPEPEWMPISLMTKRRYRGEMVEVVSETGHSVVTTADHPFVVSEEGDGVVLTRLTADRLTDSDWLPLARPVVGDRGSGGYHRASPGYRAPADMWHATLTEVVTWTRVMRTRRVRAGGSVYSLKVPGSQTVVVNGGLICHQCFPKDVSALKQLAGNTGYHFQLLTAVIEVNELQKRRVIKKLEKHLGSLAGKRVALLGLAFKPDTDDMREASSLVLAARLEGEGAEVVAYDPVAEGAARELLAAVDLRESAADALGGADAAVLVTEWPEFAELDWAQLAGRMANPLLVDGRNFLDPKALRGAGFVYEGIGRASNG